MDLFRPLAGTCKGGEAGDFSSGQSVQQLVDTYQAGMKQFLETREKYLLY